MQRTLQAESDRRLHVGVIMDGNGRWATRRGLPRSYGHRAGVEAVRRLVLAAPPRGVRALTLFAFSSANWRRPEAEVGAMMGLFQRFLESEIERLEQAGVRLSIIGRRDRLSRAVLAAIDRAEAATAAGDRLHLRVAIDYSGRDALLSAAARARGAEDLTSEGFARLLSEDPLTREIDLVIRTSGEKRLSDFLLWECAFAELHFTDRLWPDFSAEDLDVALADFAGRDRRFGALSPKLMEV